MHVCAVGVGIGVGIGGGAETGLVWVTLNYLDK